MSEMEGAGKEVVEEAGAKLISGMLDNPDVFALSDVDEAAGDAGGVVPTAADEPPAEPKPALNLDENGNALPPSRAGTGPGADGLYKPPEGPQWDDVRDAAVGQANDSPRPPGPGQPKMAAALKMPDDAYARVKATNPDAQQIYTSTSNSDVNLDEAPPLKQVIDSIPADKQSEYDWRCAEIPNLQKALKDGYTIDDFSGAQSSAAQIRGPESSTHGTWREPCDGDKNLLGVLGIEW